MPSIKVKRTTGSAPSSLAYGELGIASNHLYFGNSSNKPVSLVHWSATDALSLNIDNNSMLTYRDGAGLQRKLWRFDKVSSPPISLYEGSLALYDSGTDAHLHFTSDSSAKIYRLANISDIVQTVNGNKGNITIKVPIYWHNIHISDTKRDLALVFRSMDSKAYDKDTFFGSYKNSTIYCWAQYVGSVGSTTTKPWTPATVRFGWSGSSSLPSSTTAITSTLIFMYNLSGISTSSQSIFDGSMYSAFSIKDIVYGGNFIWFE